jgi:hypothetical protein
MNPGPFAEILLARLGIAAVWVFSPPILIALAIRDWRKADRTVPRTKVMPVAVAVAILADWAAFVLLAALGFIGGFGTHFVTTRMADLFVVMSLLLLVVTIATRVARGKLVLASLLVLALWLGSELVA